MRQKKTTDIMCEESIFEKTKTKTESAQHKNSNTYFHNIINRESTITRTTERADNFRWRTGRLSEKQKKN